MFQRCLNVLNVQMFSMLFTIVHITATKGYKLNLSLKYFVYYLHYNNFIVSIADPWTILFDN